MKTAIVFFLLALNQRVSLCQVVHSPVDLGNEQFGAYGPHFTDAFSFLQNPASLCNDSTFAAGIYSARPFMVAELAASAIALGIPMGNSALGFSLIYDGFDAYHESQLSLAYAKRLGRLVAIGIQFNDYAVHVGGFGNYHVINFSAGAIFNCSNQIHFAFQVYNPGGSKLGKSGIEKLAFVYRAGIGYELSDQILLAAELIVEEAQRPSVRAGISYSMSQQVYLLLGIASSVAAPFAGVGLQWKRFRLDLQCRYHARLGISSGLGLMFLFHTDKKPGS